VEISVKRETAVKAASLLKDLDEVAVAKAKLGIIWKKETTPDVFDQALRLADWALRRLELSLSQEVEKL
jgi:putative ubiquitin-RnfH superfamily antitoxin RatB of RatAB toxin-antitoxin module